LTPGAILGQLHKNEVSHVVWLPDSETGLMFEEMLADPTLHIVQICREGESMAVAAGLWVGGKRPVVMIQNTGFFESGDSVRGLSLDIEIPLVMMIGYRGWTRHGEISDSAARFTEPILRAWGINYHLIETDADAELISTAFEEARSTERPVACLMAAEYGHGTSVRPGEHHTGQ
jgi:sulfopyruvate decarboxylase TPP-binding subunit